MEPKVKISPKTNKPVHFSAGAIIQNDKGEYLLIDRLKKPFGFACPAGHIDKGEEGEDAIIREVKEETGLDVISIEYIETEDFLINVPQEACSHGVDVHIWQVFKIQAKGELIFKADEVKSIGWYSVEQIKKLQLESVWKFFFTELKILKMETKQILRKENFITGRMLSYSKSEYREANPTSVVYFNANIVTVTEGKIWYGDLDLTKDAETLKRAAIEIGEPLFILKEMDCRFEDEGKPTSEMLKKAVWDTTQETPTK